MQLVAGVWESIVSLPMLPWDGSKNLESHPRHTPLLPANFGIFGRARCDVRPIDLSTSWGALVTRPPVALGLSDVYDAWGELSKMIGGYLKRLLPTAPSLSLPEVRDAETWLLLAGITEKGPDFGGQILLGEGFGDKRCPALEQTAFEDLRRKPRHV